MEGISDANRCAVVRGIVLDGRGLPTGHPIAANKVIQNCLLAGVCPVSRRGVVGSSAGLDRESRNQRRRSSTTSGLPGGSSAGPRDNATQARSRPSITASELISEEIPITYQAEHLFDWSICKPNHRSNNVTKLKDGRFAVEVAGEPVRWIFSRSLPGSQQRAESIFIDEMGDGTNRVDASKTGGFVYLTEIHYYVRFETGLVSDFMSLLFVAQCFILFF